MGCCQSSNQKRNVKINSFIENNNKYKNDYSYNFQNKRTDSNVSLNINQQGDINRYLDIKNFEEQQQ